MFNMGQNTRQMLGGKRKMPRAESKARRQKVYQYIINNPDKKMKCRDLAVAAGFDMSTSLNEEYAKGASFISNMIAGGHITKQGFGDEALFYVTTKDKIVAENYTDSVTTKMEEDEKGGEDILDDSNNTSCSDCADVYNINITLRKKGSDEYYTNSLELSLRDSTIEEAIEKLKIMSKVI